MLYLSGYCARYPQEGLNYFKAWTIFILFLFEKMGENKIVRGLLVTFHK
jgi:hypothetical protein